MAQPIEMISHVARQLILLETRLSQMNLDARRVSSELLGEIAHNLSKLEGELETEASPFESCRQLAYLAGRMPLVIHAGASQATLEKLSAALADCCDPGKLVRQFQASGDHNLELAELRKAQILIRALAEGLYLAPPFASPGSAST